MKLRSLFLTLLLFTIVFSIFIPSSVFAKKDLIGLGLPLEWDCPPTDPDGSKMPTPDANGNRKLMHVVDKKGNDIDIWCRDTGGGNGHLELRVSSLQGSKSLANCTLLGGNNIFIANVTHHLQIPFMANLTNDGGLQVNVDEIHFVNHTNYVFPPFRGPDNPDSNKDTHTFYNFTSGKASTRQTTNHIGNDGKMIIDTYGPWVEKPLKPWSQTLFHSQSIQVDLYGQQIVSGQSPTCKAILDPNSEYKIDPDIVIVELPTLKSTDHLIGFSTYIIIAAVLIAIAIFIIIFRKKK